jgi:CRP/FNR family transcriptional regulator, cyclic AMP receptor protein
MSTPVSPELLQKLEFFSQTLTDELSQLAAITREERHPAGTILFREGEQLEHFFIVAEGNVVIEIHAPGTPPKRIHTVGPGELLGWSPILGNKVMTATARALTEVRLVMIDARAVLDLCDRDPRFGYHFMRRTAIAIAARLNATRLQLLDVYGAALPEAPSEVGGEA